jgi:probable rRNA maturation factor
VKLQVDIQIASTTPAPTEEEIRSWIAASVAGRTEQEQVEVCVRLVDDDEMTQLNKTFRGKTGSTNVLSFPASLPGELGLPLLGDIVICSPVVAAEAAEQGKSSSAHWAHMTVHGTLHLLGYDHIEEEDAATMETLETAILAQLNYSNPYETETSRQSEHLQ